MMKIMNMHTLYRWTGDQRFQAPTRDTVQNMQNATVAYDNGMLTLTFQRARNTGDSLDVAFTDTDCYYFMFPVGGGPHTSSGIGRHSNTPVISSEKICIGMYRVRRSARGCRLYVGRGLTFSRK